MINYRREGQFLILTARSRGMEVTLTDDGRQEIAEMKETHPDYLDFQVFNELFRDIDGNGWMTYDPSQNALTSCQLGIEKTDSGYIYWHERYQIEDAIEELLNGKLFLRDAFVE